MDIIIHLTGMCKETHFNLNHLNIIIALYIIYKIFISIKTHKFK